MASVGFGSEANIALRRVDIRGLQSGRSLITVTGTDPVRFQEQRGHFWHVATPTLIERAFLNAMNEASSDAAFGTSESFRQCRLQDGDHGHPLRLHARRRRHGQFRRHRDGRRRRCCPCPKLLGRAPLAADTPAAGVTALGAALGEAMTVFAAELADAIQVPVS